MTPLAFAMMTLVLAGPLAEDPDYLEGKRLYDEFEFEQAVFRFQKAALSSQDRAPADRAEVFIWLGLCYANAGDFDGARRQFQDALEIAPDIPLPGKASPKIAELLEEVRAEVKANPPPPDDPDDPGDDPPPDDGSVTTTGPGAGEPNLLLWGGAVGLGGVALASFAGATVLAFLIPQDLALARDPNEFQDVAKEALDRANLEAAVAVGLVGVGVLAAAGAAGLGVMAALE